MEEKNVSNVNATINDGNIAQIPFVAYEMQLERNHEDIEELGKRFSEEKKDILDRHERVNDKIRKHDRAIIISLAVALSIMIIGVFAFAFWLFSNFDFMSTTIDGDGLNNVAIETTQGDVIYEPIRPDIGEKEQEEEK